MLPTLAVRLRVGTLLSEDASSLAPAGNTTNAMSLVMAPFTPSEDLAIGDLTLATFGGATAIQGISGNQPVAVDPTTGDQVITIEAPIGGYRWTTGNMANLPQTIYGYALTNGNLTTLLATELLDTPVELTAPGQQVDLGSVTMLINQQPIS